MQPITKPTKAGDIKRAWHLVDVNDKVLGRVAGDIALKLMGKGKPYFAKNLDCGDYVVVINASLVAVTGKKEKDKIYSQFSGYPGGMKRKHLWQMRAEKPEEIIRRAVFGMLPKNKLRDRMITRLFVFAEAEHPYKDKFQS